MEAQPSTAVMFDTVIGGYGVVKIKSSPITKYHFGLFCEKKQACKTEKQINFKNEKTNKKLQKILTHIFGQQNSISVC